MKQDDIKKAWQMIQPSEESAERMDQRFASYLESWSQASCQDHDRATERHKADSRTWLPGLAAAACLLLALVLLPLLNRILDQSKAHITDDQVEDHMEIEEKSPDVSYSTDQAAVLSIEDNGPHPISLRSWSLSLDGWSPDYELWEQAEKNWQADPNLPKLSVTQAELYRSFGVKDTLSDEISLYKSAKTPEAQAAYRAYRLTNPVGNFYEAGIQPTHLSVYRNRQTRTPEGKIACPQWSTEELLTKLATYAEKLGKTPHSYTFYRNGQELFQVPNRTADGAQLPAFPTSSDTAEQAEQAVLAEYEDGYLYFEPQNHQLTLLFKQVDPLAEGEALQFTRQTDAAANEQAREKAEDLIRNLYERYQADIPFEHVGMKAWDQPIWQDENLRYEAPYLVDLSGSTPSEVYENLCFHRMSFLTQPPNFPGSRYQVSGVDPAETKQTAIWGIVFTCYDRSDRVGDYPLLTENEAEEALREGRYFSPDDLPLPEAWEDRILHIEPVYNLSADAAYFLPYYRFTLSADEASNSPEAGVYYYVLALPDQYLQTSPEVNEP